MGYRIKTVSELTGIPKNTLVAWERRYGILTPERQPNGYRLYSDKDIAILTQLKSALAEGLRISEAVARLSQPAAIATSREPSEEADAFDPIRVQLSQALRDFDRIRAEQVSQRLVSVPFSVAIDQVYFPVLRDIGTGWRAGDVSVAQEHFASAYVRSQLSAMLMGLGCGPAHGVHVACTTLPEDQHEMGALGLSVHLAASGCRVTYLGANTPVEDLGRFAKGQKPAWLCVSVIQPADLGDVVVYARSLRDLAPPETRIAIGGAGLPELDNTPVNGVAFLRQWSDLELLR